jgi:putative transposase
MAKRGHTEEEILRVLREAESGDTVVEICRKHGISQQTFYLWKKKYAGLGLSELRELRQLRAEGAAGPSAFLYHRALCFHQPAATDGAMPTPSIADHDQPEPDQVTPILMAAVQTESRNP